VLISTICRDFLIQDLTVDKLVITPYGMATHVNTPYLPLPGPALGSHARSPRLSVWTVVRYTLLVCGTILVVHALLQVVAPDHPYTSSVRTALLRPQPIESRPTWSIADSTQTVATGGFYRDSSPIKTILGFWELAEKELKAKGLDTCWDKLGPRFIEEYHTTNMAYCVPPGASTDIEYGVEMRNQSRSRNRDHNGTDLPTYITCSAIHRNSFTKWWPYPAAPCLSSNMRMIEGGDRVTRAAGCQVTNDGTRLISQMAMEHYAGRDAVMVSMDSKEGICEDIVDRTVLLIHRQDQWNP
jgi:hypothetical protein